MGSPPLNVLDQFLVQNVPVERAPYKVTILQQGSQIYKEQVASISGDKLMLISGNTVLDLLWMQHC